MAKDKPRKRVNMRDLAPKEDPGAIPVKQEDTVEQDFYNDELNDKLIEYNSRILDLDEKYSSLKFRNKILVRVFVRPMQTTDNGVMIPNKAQIKVPTTAGYGSFGYVDNPYPYENKAVIISLPEGVEDLKVGDIIGLGNNPVNAVLIGKGAEAMIQLPKAYIHPDDRAKYIESIVGVPEDPSDPNYGYLAVDNYEIETILPNE